MRTLGSILLISGSCIGAGMLGLPVISGLSGFIPAVIFFLIAWSYMLFTGLLLVEANLWYPNKKINLITLTDNTLGKYGKWLVIVLFLFLFYLLMVAYLAKGGQLVQFAIESATNLNLPDYLGAVLLALFTMALVIVGTKQVDIVNRAGMLGLFITYIFLMTVTFDSAEHDIFKHKNYDSFLFMVPFLVVSFGFHNMVSTIKDYLQSDEKRILSAIRVGSCIPLLIYLLWVFAVLLVVPLKGEVSIISAYKLKQIATEPLALITSSRSLSSLSYTFAFFAIITSIFGQALSVVDFLKDAFSNKVINKRWHYVAIFFLPCLLLSQLDTGVFFKALEYAGGLAVSILFGVLPALIVWQGRYCKKMHSNYVVFGGKLMLLVIIFFGIFMFSIELAKVLSLIDLTPNIVR